MNKVIWSWKNSTGHRGIDHYHEKLVRILNEIADIDGSDANAHSDCYSMLDRFLNCANEHFDFEKSRVTRSGGWDLSSQVIDQNLLCLLGRQLKSALHSCDITLPALHDKLLDAFNSHLSGSCHNLKNLDDFQVSDLSPFSKS